MRRLLSLRLLGLGLIAVAAAAVGVGTTSAARLIGSAGPDRLSGTPRADTDPETPARALGLGANAYFAKPYSPSAMRKKLEELIHAT